MTTTENSHFLNALKKVFQEDDILNLSITLNDEGEIQYAFTHSTHDYRSTDPEALEYVFAKALEHDITAKQTLGLLSDFENYQQNKDNTDKMFEAFANSPPKFLELLSSMLEATHIKKNRAIAVSQEIATLLASPELSDYLDRYTHNQLDKGSGSFSKVTMFSIGVLMGVDVFRDYSLPSYNFKLVWW